MSVRWVVKKHGMGEFLYGECKNCTASNCVPLTRMGKTAAKLYLEKAWVKHSCKPVKK